MKMNFNEYRKSKHFRSQQLRRGHEIKHEEREDKPLRGLYILQKD